MISGGPGKTRTCDLRFRKPLLYPAELRDRSWKNRLYGFSIHRTRSTITLKNSSKERFAGQLSLARRHRLVVMIMFVRVIVIMVMTMIVRMVVMMVAVSVPMCMVVVMLVMM